MFYSFFHFINVSFLQKCKKCPNKTARIIISVSEDWKLPPASPKQWPALASLSSTPRVLLTCRLLAACFTFHIQRQRWIVSTFPENDSALRRDPSRGEKMVDRWGCSSDWFHASTTSGGWNVWEPQCKYVCTSTMYVYTVCISWSLQWCLVRARLQIHSLIAHNALLLEQVIL